MITSYGHTDSLNTECLRRLITGQGTEINELEQKLYSYASEMQFYTISADEVPVAFFTAVTLQSNHVTVARALTADVTLSYYVTADAA